MKTKIDYSVFDRSFFPGAKTDKSKEEYASLIDKGYIPVDDKGKPFTGDNRTNQKSAFIGVNGLNYSAVYRDVFLFHQTYTPKEKPADIEKYWQEINGKMIELSEKYNQDSFVTGLITCVFDDIERQLNLLK